MKGHKAAHHGRKHRASGGVNEMAEDAKHKNMSYTYESNVEKDAKARKHGGRTGSDKAPLSSAHAGTPPRGHKDTDID